LNNVALHDDEPGPTSEECETMYAKGSNENTGN